MRFAMTMIASVAALLAAGCDGSATAGAKPAFTPASDKECAAMVLVAREKLHLNKVRQSVLRGMERKDWRPTCDWEANGIKFQDYNKVVGFDNIGDRGDEFTFHRPQFNPEGVDVVVESLGFGNQSHLLTCRLSGYDTTWSIFKCREDDLYGLH